MHCGSRRLFLNFKDPKVLQTSKTSDLCRSYALFTAFSFNPLIRHAYGLYQWFPRTFEFFARPAFSQFCAGASEVDVAPRLAQLRAHGVKAILDYAAESSADLERNVTILQRGIAAVAAESQSDAVAVKVTALATVEDLKRFSASLAAMPVAKWPSLDKTGVPDYLQPAFARTERIVQFAHEKKVSVYIDAEWLEIQPAIEFFALSLMRRFNRSGRGEATSGLPTVYTTYQCYLQRTPEVVRRDLELARSLDFAIGAKVVRGAYLTSEKARAKAEDLADPVCATYDATSANYHKVLELLAPAMTVPSVLVATHNPDSVNYAIGLAERGVQGKFQFAQLLGMADNISLALAADSRFPVFKYVPYGPMDEVMPYLLRRAQENSALMGSVHVKNECQMIRSELKRRLSW